MSFGEFPIGSALLLVAAGIGVVTLWAVYTLLQGVAAWRRARREGVLLGLGRVIAWRLSRLRLRPLMEAAVFAQKRGLEASPDDIEAAALAGGDPLRALQAMDEARRRGAKLDFVGASALEMSNTTDVMEAAKTWKVVSVRGAGVLVSPEGEFVLGQRSEELSAVVGQAAAGEE